MVFVHHAAAEAVKINQKRRQPRTKNG